VPDAPHTSTQISRGLAWIGVGSTLIGVLDLGAMVILLQVFLTPAEYGIAALAIAGFPLLDQLTDMGLSAAVIQRDDHTPERIATVFWLNVIMSLVVVAILAVAAPLYARWQGYPVVAPMLIVYGGKLFLDNVSAIPAAMMKRELRFKELSLIRIVANVAEFAGKVGFAALGFGVWCFVLAALMRAVIFSAGVQLRHPWRPGLNFRPREAAAYARFGLSTSASQILFRIYTNADYPVVGKLFGATALAFYRAAYELVLELVKTISSIFTEMGFSAFSRLRYDREKLVAQFIGLTRQSLVAIVPFLLFTAVAAEETLTVVWGREYASAALAARVLCWVGLVRALGVIIPPLLDGMGFPSLTLRYHVVAMALLPALFAACGRLLGPPLGYVSVAVAWAVGYPVACAALVWMALVKMELGPLTYLRRIAGIPGCGVLAAPAAYAAHRLAESLPALPRLAVVWLAGGSVFFVLLAYLQGISPRSIWRALR
jgi:teichuronic acid exporter